MKKDTDPTKLQLTCTKKLQDNDGLSVTLERENPFDSEVIALNADGTIDSIDEPPFASLTITDLPTKAFSRFKVGKEYEIELREVEK